MKFTNTGFMFRNPVVNVFHCQAIEMCVGYDIVKREDVEAMLKVGVLSHITSETEASPLTLGTQSPLKTDALGSKQAG